MSPSCCPVILSFDLIVYYLLVNSFIFNLFPWPEAMDSDTVIFFTGACHTSLWIIWSYSWGQCYHSSTRYRSVRHTGCEVPKSSPFLQFPSCSHFAVAILNPPWFTWKCKMVQNEISLVCVTSTIRGVNTMHDGRVCPKSTIISTDYFITTQGILVYWNDALLNVWCFVKPSNKKNKKQAVD